MRDILTFLKTPLIFIFLAQTTIKTNSQSQNAPIMQQYTVVSQSQYHFINNGSYFQFSIAGWSLEMSSSTLDQLTSDYQIKILTTNSYYNFIVFFTDNSTNMQPYQNYNCYVRAANEGVPQQMQLCNFGNIYISQTGSCAQQILTASNNNFATTNSFLNCSDLSFTYQLDIWNGDTALNGTMLFILDNSGLVPGGAISSGSIELIQAVNLYGDVNQEMWTQLYIFCGLAGILILISALATIIVSVKIRQVNAKIDQLKTQKYD